MSNPIRSVAATAAILSATCLMLTACQGSTGPTDAGSAPTVSVSPVSAASGSPATGSGDSSGSNPTGAPTTAVAGASGAPIAVDPVRCTAESLTAAPAEPQPSSAVTSTYDEFIKLTNSGQRSCTVSGFPTVAMAGEGDPTRNKPLKVVQRGAAHSVRLAPGHSAWLRLSFRVVMGEASGYCASGATPDAPPTLVLGLHGGGGIQIEEANGGNFASCDGIVWASSFLTSRP